MAPKMDTLLNRRRFVQGSAGLGAALALSHASFVATTSAQEAGDQILRLVCEEPELFDTATVGGGIGIRYKNESPQPPEAFVRGVLAALGRRPHTVIFDPGRSIVGNAGLLLTRVEYVKPGFLVVDAGMNDLIRPTLYDAHHAILTVEEPGEDDHPERVDVVGPICESGDVFAEQRPLPPVATGALLAIGTAGAYGSVMSSFYNARPPAAEVLVKGSRFATIRPRATIAELIGRDRLPDWLVPPEAVRSSI